MPFRVLIMPRCWASWTQYASVHVPTVPTSSGLVSHGTSARSRMAAREKSAGVDLRGGALGLGECARCVVEQHGLDLER